ncbi:MAG: GspH/FimT family pseudopilin [Thiobacillus sp.]|uniref:GspH/FimT family pseudopilin n=1 Tax=Thiobacillus sp. TaxID=924 RepID=UPI0028950D47|nr:GspH/FimT family pseudopilin [Thiobacillus sp.]MDT3705528.1 GspH/FimT family pseudopilin [Thiobacillus sp.]
MAAVAPVIEPAFRANAPVSHGCRSPALGPNAADPERVRLRNDRTKQSGFTLIEILAVLVIIGIVVGLASVRLMPDDQGTLANEAQRLALLLEQTRDQAVASGEPIGFSVEAGRYRFWTLDAENEWVPRSGDELLQDRPLASGVKLLALQVNQVMLAAGDHLLFSPSGSNAPFTADLGLNAAHVRLRGDSLGRVQVEHAEGAE